METLKATNLNEQQPQKQFLTELHFARYNFAKQNGKFPNVILLHPENKIRTMNEYKEIFVSGQFIKEDGIYFADAKIIFSERIPKDEIQCGFVETLKII